MSLSIADFDFDLPDALIAQEARPRGQSRLLVVDRAAGRWAEHRVADLPRLLSPGDLIVANDTRVFPARLLGRREPSGGAVECLLLERAAPFEWDALVHPGQKLKPGSRMRFEDEARAPGVRIDAEILERRFFGRRRVRFAVTGARDLDDAVDRLGHIPLPPYIQRGERADDRERYQTIYAAARGSIAAPTAGLHFDEALVADLRAAGIDWRTITLHVGYGTFKPVRVERIDEHQVDAESYAISEETAAAIRRIKTPGVELRHPVSSALRHPVSSPPPPRVVAVGTTTTRALESAAAASGIVEAAAGRTELFIRPGHEFRAVDALITNFHLPRSSLLVLVAAFAGRELILDAYRDAVRREFHFYSYGDAMLIV